MNQHFFFSILPVFFVLIAGTILAGFGVWLWAWIPGLLIFFLVIEPIILCRYCPYWGMPGNVLKCHANYGVLKFFKYKPGESSKLEKIAFEVCAIIVIGYPLVLILLGHEYLFFALGIVTGFSFVYTAKRSICTKCINFSCPMNSVDAQTKAQYLNQNDKLKRAFHKDNVEAL